jgi:hypothetical protein
MAMTEPEPRPTSTPGLAPPAPAASADAPLPDLALERALLVELETDLAAIDAELRSLDGTS